MSLYRFSLLEADESPKGEETHRCSGDNMAVKFARVLLGQAAAVVVWQDTRLVRRVTATELSERDEPADDSGTSSIVELKAFGPLGRPGFEENRRLDDCSAHSAKSRQTTVIARVHLSELHRDLA